jgi:hypothetical protein
MAAQISEGVIPATAGIHFASLFAVLRKKDQGGFPLLRE